ncbi:MAG: hypothetical protein JNM80_12665 [Phycisphaerae bacterium]|nr:hypothetical protein [Phycisphaerae bacterium]
MRSITSSATSVESCTDNIAASPTSANGSYPWSGGTIAWQNAGNVYSANNAYASATLGGEERTKFLRAGAFSFGTLPDDAIIRGVVLSIRRYADVGNTIKEAALQWHKEDFICDVNRATGAYVGTTLETVSYGATSEIDPWGENFPVATQYKAPNFGVLLGYNNDFIGSDDSPATIHVDHVQLTIYYDEVPSCGGLSSVTAWAGFSSAPGGWTNPTYGAGSPDGLVAHREVSHGTGQVYITFSSFATDSIPSNATILGVQVAFRASVSGACQRWHYIQLVDGSSAVGRAKFMFIEPNATTLRDYEHGHCEDTWPYAGGPYNEFTPAMFNNQTFKVLVSLESHWLSGTVSADIDAVKLTVWYE